MKRHLLLLALIPVLAACDAMTAHTDVVARAGSHELTVDGLVDLLATNPQIPPRPEVAGSVADLWVDYTILADLAASDSTLADLDVAGMIQPYVEQETFSVLRDQVMTADTMITDEELRREYAEQGPGLRIRARHILLTYPEGAEEATRDSVRELAEELAERARAGDDFETMAREHSQDPGSAQSGGDLGWFQRGRMVQPFEEAAFALETGEVSDVVETPFGLHIIKVEERETTAWDEERGAEFRQQLLNQRRQASLDEYVESLRGPANVEIESGAADVARELASDPSGRLGSRAASRELVTWDGGALTAREFVNVLRRIPPPQQAQYATAQDEQIEGMLGELAVNELVLEDARERGIEVPQAEQDSIKELIMEQLTMVARERGLTGAPQADETEAEAVERRVRALLQGVLSGQDQLVQLGPLKYAMRDQIDWRINESRFQEVAEKLQERREGQSTAPMPPEGARQPAPGGGAPPVERPDTAG